jgi:Fibronectin type III domain
MPTISELPPATTVAAADEIPISQGGIARAASVGTLLASTQPAIIVESPSLLGRTSIGSGGPEPVGVGIGVSLSSGTLVADGLDHAGFPTASNLYVASDLVISNQGSPMLMQASLLRDLFSAGQNVTINPNGVISASGQTAASATTVSGSSIGELQVVTTLSTQDLVAVSHAGTDCAIAYSNLLDGITIDQAPAAGPASNSDTIWVAQGSNVMASQTFSAIWVWLANNLPTYRAPVVEIIASTNLDTTVHNGRILVCSQPITLTPLTTNMGSGFQCMVINASTGNLTLGSGFVSSSGSLVLTPWQTATLCCITYSAGTIALAVMPTTTSTTTAASVPGQVSGVVATPTSSSAVQLTWSAQIGTGAATTFTVQYRVTGSSSWTFSVAGLTGTGAIISGLEAATKYDFGIIGINSAGAGPASSAVTAMTLAASGSVTAIAWNLLPSGTYTHGSGTIGVNAQVTPAPSPVQFGFSLSATTPPTSWTAAILVNTNLWGAYVPTPATAGTWYTWGEGLDGSEPTVSPSAFLVQ